MFGLIIRIGSVLLAVLVLAGVLWGVLKIFGYSVKFYRTSIYSLLFLACVGLIPLALNPLMAAWNPQLIEWQPGFLIGLVLAYFVWRYFFWRDLKINGWKTLGYLVAVVLVTSLILKVWAMIFFTVFQSMH